MNALDKVNDVSQLFVKGSKKKDTSPKGSVAKFELFKTAESYLQCVHCIRWVEKIDGYNHFLLTYPYIDEAFEVISHKPYLKKYPDLREWSTESWRTISALLECITTFEFCIVWVRVVRSLFYFRSPTRKIQGRSLNSLDMRDR